MKKTMRNLPEVGSVKECPECDFPVPPTRPEDWKGEGDGIEPIQRKCGRCHMNWEERWPEEEPDKLPAQARPGIADVVVFHDDEGKARPALVTRVFEGSTRSLNLVFLCKDRTMIDRYGRQIEHRTSVPHKTTQESHTFYWRWLEEEPNPVCIAPVKEKQQRG